MRTSSLPTGRFSAPQLTLDRGRGYDRLTFVTNPVPGPQTLTAEVHMERCKFLVNAGGALVAAGATAAVEAPNVIAQPKYQWRMPTFWSPANDILIGSAQKFAKMVEEAGS